MYSEEDSRVLIERSESVLRKSRAIQQKADEATKHFNKVLKANDALIARLTAWRHLPSNSNPSTPRSTPQKSTVSSIAESHR